MRAIRAAEPEVHDALGLGEAPGPVRRMRDEVVDQRVGAEFREALGADHRGQMAYERPADAACGGLRARPRSLRGRAPADRRSHWRRGAG